MHDKFGFSQRPKDATITATAVEIEAAQLAVEGKLPARADRPDLHSALARFKALLSKAAASFPPIVDKKGKR